MRKQRAQAIVANPVLVGAVTTLVVIVAVFLAYNANKGLPFVPTYEVKLDIPDAARLVVGNEVREGGFRIGQVTKIEPVRLKNGQTGAQVTLQLETAAGDLPRDTTATVRPRSALGQKYIDLKRGFGKETLPAGATLQVLDPSFRPPEIDDLFNMFDARTRANIQQNLATFGSGFAGRGLDLNRTLAALPRLLEDIQPLMRTLSDPDTGLARMLSELEDFMTLIGPVSDDFNRGFTVMADTFEALSAEPERLAETIRDSPETLSAATSSLIAQRPLLDALVDISDEIRGSAREIRFSAPRISRTLAIGTRVLPRVPQLSEDLATSFRALRDVTASPTTNAAIDSLTATVQTLNPTLRWVGPHVTVCNYFTAWWTYLADNLSEEDATGTLQRVQVKNGRPDQPNPLPEFGATRPANGGPNNPLFKQMFGDPAHLHAQPYGRAVDEQGNADCESGQRGYPRRIAEGAPEDLQIAVDPRTPGSQGPTFSGRPRVPAGQTFSAEPTGRAEGVLSGRARGQR